MTSEEGEGVDHMLVAVEVGQFGRFAQSEGTQVGEPLSTTLPYGSGDAPTRKRKHNKYIDPLHTE